jgi:hypothetical protein
MPVSPIEAILAALGFTRDEGRLYGQLLPLSGRTLEGLAKTVELPEQELAEFVDYLSRTGVAYEEDGRVHFRPPGDVVAAYLETHAGLANAAHVRLIEVARVLPYLSSGAQQLEPPDARHNIDGDVMLTEYRPEMLEAIFAQSSGEVRWLRPDQWQHAWDENSAALVRRMTALGRRVRAIYPARMVAEAPHLLAARAELGEDVRVLVEVPTRLVVLGGTHALMPDPMGVGAAPRMVIRQRGIVQALALLFDQLWARAEVPYLGEGRVSVDMRAMLLEQLASGAQDEQIARRLGVSLRTVRRRVAGIMSELGVDSRFAAGVEAVRRGWL